MTAPQPLLLLQQPIPPLADTLATCRRSVMPFLNAPQSMKCRLLLSLYGVASMRHQKALLQRLHEDGINWGAEGLLRLYLSCRGGLPFHNNYPVLLRDDPGASTLTERAACLIVAALALRQEIYGGHLPPDMEASLPLEMSQYRNCFSTYRIPCPTCDTLARGPESSHIAVMVGGQVYCLAIDQGQGQVTGSQVRAGLDWILDDARSGMEQHLGPGTFTALPRQEWARLRGELLRRPLNRRGLALLNQSLFVVCLDDESTPTSAGALALLRDGVCHNRYYDKGMQIIVFANGRAGLCFEHAAVDGGVALGFARHLQRRALAIPLDAPPRVDNPARVRTRRLSWDISRDSQARARDQVNHALGEREIHTWSSPASSRRRLLAPKVSADAAVQLAIQLATCRYFGRILSVYEPVQIRRFAGGRLDFIAPVTSQSRAFVKAVADAGGSPSLPARLLHEAAGAHQRLIDQAKGGCGFIAHLLALSAVEFPDDPVKGAMVQTRRQKLLSRLDKGLGLIIHQDVMASNGSAGAEIAAFGTITARPHMIGIGYTVEDQAITFDVLSTGRYYGHGRGLRDALEAALQTVGGVLEGEGADLGQP